MTHTEHPDEIELLRAALWGERDATLVEIERHAAGCAPCGEEMSFQRRVRDAFRFWADSELPAGAVERAAGLAEPVVWVPASRLLGLAGVRSAATAEPHFCHSGRRLRLDVVVHADAQAGRVALTGQALRADSRPLADVEVTLFTDREPVASARTDAFGEFSFEAAAGSRYGLRIAADGETEHVEILVAEGQR